MSAKRVEYQQGAFADVKSAVAPGDVGSVRSRPKHQIKTRSFGERPEVSVSRKERCLGRYSSERSARRRGAPCGSLPAPSPAALLPVANSLVRSQPEALLREFRQRRREASGRLKAR